MRHTSLTSSLAVLLALASMPWQAAAQSQQTDWEKAFWERAKSHAQSFDSTTRSHFEQMRSNFNAEYADALDGIWKHYEVLPPADNSIKKKPRKAPVAPKPDTAPLKPVDIVPSKIVLPPVSIDPVPLTIPNDPTPTLPDRSRGLSFDFYGTTCEIGDYNFDPIDYNPQSMKLGSEWKKHEADGDMQSLIDDCPRLREALSLCDIGYLWLTEHVAKKIYPSSTDSQAFLTSYLLNQTGYDVKLGLTDKGLTLLYNTDLPVYGCCSVNFNGRKYYVRDSLVERRPIRSYEGLYAANEAIPLRLTPDRMPALDTEMKDTVQYSSKLWVVEPEFKVTVSRPDMKFLADYPWMSWENYLRAPLTDNFRNQVVETMREKVKGLDTFDGVRKLLSYVQYGFNYMTDPQQYGHEKVNFPEENFFYPANDCEDRAILLATLVREIYGLDVVLLHYDGHLSTAIDFRDPTIKGDAINIDGHHYVMCDPTFIGAPIGMSMPNYRNQQPIVYKQ